MVMMMMMMMKMMCEVVTFIQDEPHMNVYCVRLV